MAQRPERKRSALGAAHPIEHQNSQTPVSKALEDVPYEAPGLDGAKDTLSPEGKQPAAAPTPSEASSGKRGKPQPKGSFYANETELERIRAAWFHTPTTAAEREPSFSDFLREAALDRMLKREQTYNGGQPFPVVRSGKIARGRR